MKTKAWWCIFVALAGVRDIVDGAVQWAFLKYSASTIGIGRIR